MQSVRRGWRWRAALCGALAGIFAGVGAAGAQTFTITPASVTEADNPRFVPLTLAVSGSSKVSATLCYAVRIAYQDQASTAGPEDVWLVEGRDVDAETEVAWFSVAVDASGAGSAALAGDTGSLVLGGDDVTEPDEAFVVQVGALSVCPDGNSEVRFPSGAPDAVRTIALVDDDEELAPGISRGVTLRVREPGTGWAKVVMQLPLVVEDAEAGLIDSYCFPYELGRRGSATIAAGGDGDVRFAGSQTAGQFVVGSGKQTFAASDDLEINGDSLVEGEETFLVDVYAAQRNTASCSKSGPIIAEVTVVIEDADEDTSDISPTAFTVEETDEDGRGGVRPGVRCGCERGTTASPSSWPTAAAPPGRRMRGSASAESPPARSFSTRDSPGS